MKNTKIILSAILFLSIFGIVGKVSAESASLNVSPTNVSKATDEVFNISVNLVPSDNSVCAVEGTLDFKNLSCQSITLANDVMNQSSLSCTNPHFLVGIPNCTTTDKVLMTVQVKANNMGTAGIITKAIDIIGDGVSLSNAGVGGDYIITTAPTKEVSPIVTPTVETTTTPAQETSVLVNPTTNKTGDLSGANNLTASAGQVRDIIKGPMSIWIILLIIAILLGGGYAVYVFTKKVSRVKIKKDTIKPITPITPNVAINNPQVKPITPITPEVTNNAHINSAQVNTKKL